MVFTRNKYHWLGLLVAGMFCPAVFAQDSSVPPEGKDQPQWVTDAIEMAEFIEENELVMKPNSHAEYEKRVFKAPSDEKLDRLYAMLLDSLFLESEEVIKVYLPIYLEEIERSNSAVHKDSLRVLNVAKEGFLSWSYDAAINALEAIAFDKETHPFAKIRALSIAGAFHGYSGNADDIVKYTQEMDAIAKNAPKNLFIEKEIVGLKGAVAAYTNDPEEMVKYAIEDINLGYQTGSLINGDVTTGNFTYLIMENADLKSIDRIDALNQRIAHMTGDKSVIFRAYVSCLESAIRTIRTERALECQSNASKYRDKNTQIYVRYRMYSAIALARAGRVKKARAYLDELQNIPDIQSSVYYKKDGKWATSEVLQSEGRYVEAYVGLRDYFNQKVLSQKVELGQVSRSLRLHGEKTAALQEAKNKFLASREALQESVISRQRTLILLSVIIALGMLWFAYLQMLNTRRLRSARQKTLLANQAIRKEARTDQLTRIGNRRAFYEYCTEMSRNSEYSSLTLAILDLDGFKQVNDTHGHEAGDTLIIETSQRLSQMLKGKGRVFRLGGDEFAIIFLPQDNDKLSTFQSCVRKAFEGAVEIGKRRVDLVASVGAVKLQGKNLTPLNSLHHADYALYQAKEQRGTSIHVFSEQDFQSISQENLIAEQVLWNLDTASFVMFGQIVVKSVKGTLQPFGVEAILRAQTRYGEVISPEVFVRHAVMAGKRDFLTKLSLVKSIEMFNNSDLECPLMFNLSREQFTSQNLLKVILETLEEKKFPPGLLVIELSEHTLDHDLVLAAETLAALKKMGVRIAIDDFGSANTGFSTLFQFGFDIIKTDRNFLTSAMKEERRKYLMSTLIELTTKLNVPCVIEGLETQDEVSFVREIGGDVLQGYLFGRPEETPKFRPNTQRFISLVSKETKSNRTPRKTA